MIPTGSVGVLVATEGPPEKPIWVAGERGRQAYPPETRELGVFKGHHRLKVGPVDPVCSLAVSEDLMLRVSMRLIGPTTLGSSFGSCRCTTLPGAKCHRRRRRGVMARIGDQFDMRHLNMESDRWPPYLCDPLQQHLQKIYNGKKAALKEKHWIPDSDGTYDMERIRQSRPSHISEDELKRLQRGHILGVGRVLPRQHTVIPPPPPCTHSSDVTKLKKRKKGMDELGDDEDDGGEWGEDEDDS
ncbi:hypothetical protein Tco_1076420 [Tanacetum coccineum]